MGYDYEMTNKYIYNVLIRRLSVCRKNLKEPDLSDIRHLSVINTSIAAEPYYSHCNGVYYPQSKKYVGICPGYILQG